MSIPITGVLLIPLGLIIALLPWRFCLVGLMVFSMLSPSAVVNVGSFGLQPGYYLALLLISRSAFEIMTQHFTLNGFVMSRMRPLWWFVATVFAVLFIALCFFQGDVEVLPGTYGFKSGLTHPFRLARENFTQIAYLLTNMCLVYTIAHSGARQQSAKLLAAWDAAMVCGLCFAAAVCAWQFASFYAGVPFPADFFYSNAGYSRADSQAMVGLLRINGPFEEPSVLGYTFTGYLLYAWGRYRTHPTALTIAMIAASIVCLLLSASTTALMGIFLFICVVLFDIVSGRVTLLRKNITLSPGHVAILGLIFVGVTVGGFAVAANWEAIQIILKTVLFNKADSTSFQERSFADYLALQIFTQTYGIGVGLGSHKANSLALTLLSNTGAIGLVLFGAFVLGMFRLRDIYENVPASFVVAIRPFQLFLLGLLMVHVISNPNLSVLTLWLVIGSVLALQASERSKAGAAKSVLDRQLGPPNPLAAPRHVTHASV
jgi:hypothetical protein